MAKKSTSQSVNQTPKAFAPKEVTGILSSTNRQERPRYVSVSLEAVEESAAMMPWSFGGNLAARLKGYTWAMPAAAAIVPSGDKLLVTLPCDAIVEASTEVSLPNELVQAAEYKAMHPDRRNYEREAHLTLCSFSRRRTLMGGWTNWTLDEPLNERQAKLQALFEEVDLRSNIEPTSVTVNIDHTPF